MQHWNLGPQSQKDIYFMMALALSIALGIAAGLWLMIPSVIS
jgi:Na+(H+)/acetate symporter ActP